MALYEWLLMKYAEPGQKILDTHVGSGSSLIACAKYGCTAVGMEIDPAYYDGAWKRVMDEVGGEVEVVRGV